MNTKRSDIAKQRDSVTFMLNGRLQKVQGQAVFSTLADYLRYQLQMTGTKIVCAEGDCGACTVLKAQSPDSKNLSFEAINSCICLVGQLDGAHIVSIEGLEENSNCHPAQSSMINSDASQCGFCTPGFAMAIAGIYEKHKPLNEQDIKNHLTGNLCRCTGYDPILEAAKLCLNQKGESLKSRYLKKANILELKKQTRKSKFIKDNNKIFFIPKNLKELTIIRQKHPNSTLLSAGTDLGVQINKGKAEPLIFISLHAIPELHKIKKTAQSIEVGAKVSLSELRRALPKNAETVKNFLNIFASPQIKNMATLAGNIANASPIADTPAFLLALNAQLKILRTKTKKTISIPLKDFYLAYKKTQLIPGDVIVSITFDLPRAKEKVSFKKVSQRRDLDISCVNGGFWMKLSQKGIIEDLRFAMGGVAPYPLRLLKTETQLKGKKLDTIEIKKALETLNKEIHPISDLRGSKEYRLFVGRKLLENFLNESIEGHL
jgi:xanthine dehydrogenase small subunit